MEEPTARGHDPDIQYCPSFVSGALSNKWRQPEWLVISTKLALGVGHVISLAVVALWCYRFTTQFAGTWTAVIVAAGACALLNTFLTLLAARIGALNGEQTTPDRQPVIAAKALLNGLTFAGVVLFTRWVLRLVSIPLEVGFVSLLATALVATFLVFLIESTYSAEGVRRRGDSVDPNYRWVVSTGGGGNATRKQVWEHHGGDWLRDAIRYRRFSACALGVVWAAGVPYAIHYFHLYPMETHALIVLGATLAIESLVVTSCTLCDRTRG